MICGLGFYETWKDRIFARSRNEGELCPLGLKLLQNPHLALPIFGGLGFFCQSSAIIITLQPGLIILCLNHKVSVHVRLSSQTAVAVPHGTAAEGDAARTGNCHELSSVMLT